ncbi:MAG: hypothetical protein L3J82_01935 [Planctomycetes bacterium]|nr:hypothetical protein [Planctomycetota bacterium]
MNLTDKQLQLLHAHLDGELDAAETEEAQELREDSGGREYFDTFLKIRGLIKTHSNIPAPEGLKDHVLANIKPAPVTKLDDYRWRGGWIAAAATVVVSVGVIFGLGSTESLPERTVAVSSFADYSIAEISGEPEALDKRKDRGSKEGSAHTDGETQDDSNNARQEDARESSKPTPKRMVLNLDRGRDEPMSLNLHLNRAQTISVDQAYNELLMVSAMYGQAELQETDDFDETFEDDFEGNDFSSIEGVLISIPEHELAELLASVTRMANDQSFGRVAVPEDLAQSVKTIGQTLRAEVAEQKLALGYAPQRTREQVNESKKFQNYASKPAQPETEPPLSESRKIKLLLRLR